ncbi:hypothetical protein WISP_124133 [Willisornis vidua]|uniref:Uncharacterized protein n=1 Tax=Willisornis vidua TaxID=1566151 RepID=A0ABQ9CW71_9PASS|nr:hypothetical protein WISP_124133 [Willisornis vidua]
MKFSKILSLGWGNPLSLQTGRIDSSPSKEDLGVLGYEKLDRSQQCTLIDLTVNCILGCKARGQQNKRADSASRLLPFETPPAILHTTLRPSAQESTQDTTNVTGAPPYEDRLRAFRLFSLEKRRLRGNLIAAIPYLQGA